MDNFVEKLGLWLAVLWALPAQGATYTDSVRYLAEQVVVEGKRVELVGGARMWYRDMALSAGKITLFMDRDLLVAEGLKDSSGRTVQTPILHQGGEKLEGVRMVYNFRTGRGAVWQGKTQFEKGVYWGQKVVRSEDGVLYVQGGVYTTCDLAHPHYHFYSPRMKVTLDDKVVARPVIFYLGEVPILRLPFMVFPIRKGRHSGWLRPQYGSTSREGRYIRNIGYYFAPSDYWDIVLRADMYERVGLVLTSRLRYALRYRFRGSIGGSWKWERGGRRWDLELRHTQTPRPKLRLEVDGHFVSDREYLRDVRFDPVLRMRRTLRSTATLTRNWRGGGGLSLVLQQIQYLDRNEDRYSLPRMSLSLPQYALGGKKLYFRPSLRAGYTVTQSGGRWSHDAELSGNSGLSGNLRWGWARLSSSLRTGGRARWDDGTFSHREELSGSFGVRTILYGLFPVTWGSIQAARHVLQPSLFLRGSRSWEDGRPSSWKASMSGSLNSILQVKWGRGKRPKKLDLFNVSFSSGCDLSPKASRRLSDLRTSVRSSPFRSFDLRADLRHSFYRNGKLSRPHLRDFSLTASLRMSGKGKPVPRPGSSWVPGVETAGVGPWGLVLSGYYRREVGGTGRTFWVRGSAQVQPTSRWRVRYSFNYDLGKGQMVAQEIYVYRDLHCWEAIFQWSPSGMRRGYYFVLRIKELPEIKIERRKGVW
ncbi:MAG TPA: LPS-assembly protein LptD [Candidatus Latescibacteria bacterium]|nr:LPS-assembly protein LptD [Candidatus Latescibacterota bacterium]